MIETTFFYFLKAACLMAGLTISSEFSIVKIFVARITVCKRNIFKYLEIFSIAFFISVAFGTIYINMQTCKFISCIIVIKSSSRSEFLNIMTWGAIITKCLLMKIFVTIITISCKSQVSTFSLFKIIIRNIFWLMAIITPGPGMCIQQFISRFSMIEFFRIKIDYSEFPAMMFTMAGIAILTFNFTACMVSRIWIDQRLNFFMTTEAILVVYFLTNFMTLSAIADSFKIRMRSCQVTRWYLRKNIGGLPNHKKDY